MRGGRIAASGYALAALVALAALCAACGDDPEDGAHGKVTFGHAPAASGRIPVPETGHGALDGAHWPDSCRFLTDADIRAMLPETEKVRREPIRITANLDGRSHPRNFARAGECWMDLSLRGGTVGKAQAVMKVKIEAVGGPHLISRRYAKEKSHPVKFRDPEMRRDYGSRLGPDACFVIPGMLDGTLMCRQGPMLYRVSGGCYCDIGAQPNTLSKRQVIWINKVLGPAAKTIAAKIA